MHLFSERCFSLRKKCHCLGFYAIFCLTPTEINLKVKKKKLDSSVLGCLNAKQLPFKLYVNCTLIFNSLFYLLKQHTNGVWTSTLTPNWCLCQSENLPKAFCMLMTYVKSRIPVLANAKARPNIPLPIMALLRLKTDIPNEVVPGICTGWIKRKDKNKTSYGLQHIWKASYAFFWI